MPSTETVAHFLRRCRLRLDEELDPTGNLWSDTELIEYINEGVREVHTTLRETSENWFIRKMRSTDAKQTINGRVYDPALFRLESGRNELVLPPDFHELILLETKPGTDGTRSNATFVFEKMTNNAFRELYDAEATQQTVRFRYDIEHRIDGTVMVLTPTPGESVDLTMKYVQSPPELVKTMTFEDTGLEPFMLDAVLAYVLWAARGKEDEGSAAEKSAAGRWEGKREHATRAAGPRQRRDPEFVEGFYENDDD